MRSNTAFVLATLAVGQAAAGALKHANFHARRSQQGGAEIDHAKRAPVDYGAISYDAEAIKTAVDWSKVVYNVAGALSSSSTPAAVSVAAYTSPSSEAAYTSPSSEAAYTTPTPTPTPAYTPPTSSSAAAPASSSKASTPSVAGSIMKLVSSLGLATASNPSSGSICLGDSGSHVTEVTNNSGEDMLWVVWTTGNSFVNVVPPIITTAIGAGETVTIGLSEGASGAMAPLFASDVKDVVLKWGSIMNTWLEFTIADAGKWGAQTTFDVSMLPNMAGVSIVAETAECVTSMTECVFQCKNGLSNCMQAADVALVNTSQESCIHATDGSANGGCKMTSKTIKVTVG